MRSSMRLAVLVIALVLAGAGTLAAQGPAKVTVFEAWFIGTAVRKPGPSGLGGGPAPLSPDTAKVNLYT